MYEMTPTLRGTDDPKRMNGRAIHYKFKDISFQRLRRPNVLPETLCRVLYYYFKQINYAAYGLIHPSFQYLSSLNKDRIE